MNFLNSALNFFNTLAAAATSLSPELAVLSSMAWIFCASNAGSVVTANRPHMNPMVAESPDRPEWTL